MKLLKHINLHKSGGSYHIKHAVLKELAAEVVPILTIICRNFMLSGESPSP